MRKFFIATVSVATLCSCRNEDNPVSQQEEVFDLTNYFIGGTTAGSQTSMNKSVYVIQFLEDNKAVFSNSGTDFMGEYKLTDDSIIVKVPDASNYKEAKFAINDKHELTSAYYKALLREYAATGVLVKKPESNQFAKNTYTGSEYRWGSLFNRDWFYKFSDDGLKYNVGASKNDITADREMTMINNAAFRYKGDNITEIGFISGDSLTVSRVQGLYFFGTYKKVN